MIKYEATGLVENAAGGPSTIHGFIFVNDTASTPHFQYNVSSFFLGWDDFIFAGNLGYLNFQYFDNHGMDGDIGQSLSLEKSDTKILISGSETVILDRPLIQDPSKFTLPNTLRYMASLNSIDPRFTSCELWLHRACCIN